MHVNQAICFVSPLSFSSLSIIFNEENFPLPALYMLVTVFLLDSKVPMVSKYDCTAAATYVAAES